MIWAARYADRSYRVEACHRNQSRRNPGQSHGSSVPTGAARRRKRRIRTAVLTW
jgi:hypothetical protein